MSFINNHKIYFSSDEKFVKRISGIDMQAKMPVLFRSGEYCVFKRNGFTGWISRGETGYYPPNYYLIRVVDGVIVEVLKDIEADSQTWRKIKSDLIEQARQL